MRMWTAAEAKKSVASAEAGRVAALLDYTKIRAHVRRRHHGEERSQRATFLQPNASGKPEPIFVVSRQDIVRIFVDVPEAASEKAGAGAKATVRFPALSNREYPATVTRSSQMISPETRTLRVEIDLVNKDGAIKPGMYARAIISANTVQAFILPAGAILFADETAYCYRVEAGKAVKLRVQVGKQDGGNLEVVGAKRTSGPPNDWEAVRRYRIDCRRHAGCPDGWARRCREEVS